MGFGFHKGATQWWGGDVKWERKPQVMREWSAKPSIDLSECFRVLACTPFVPICAPFVPTLHSVCADFALRLCLTQPA